MDNVVKEYNHFYYLHKNFIFIGSFYRMAIIISSVVAFVCRLLINRPAARTLLSGNDYFGIFRIVAAVISHVRKMSMRAVVWVRLK